MSGRSFALFAGVRSDSRASLRISETDIANEISLSIPSPDRCSVWRAMQPDTLRSHSLNQPALPVTEMSTSPGLWRLFQITHKNLRWPRRRSYACTTSAVSKNVIPQSNAAPMQRSARCRPIPPAAVSQVPVLTSETSMGHSPAAASAYFASSFMTDLTQRSLFVPPRDSGRMLPFCNGPSSRAVASRTTKLQFERRLRMAS
jgi:hypothetical protein